MAKRLNYRMTWQDELGGREVELLSDSKGQVKRFEGQGVGRLNESSIEHNRGL